MVGSGEANGDDNASLEGRGLKPTRKTAEVFRVPLEAIVKQPAMDDFERAIERMRKKVTACEELIADAETDIADLEEQKTRAKQMIDGWTILLKKPHMATAEMRKVAAEIADREPQLVSIMNIGIKV